MSHQVSSAPSTPPALDVPRFSRQERDRRWARVRALMERDGLDVIVAPTNTGGWDSLQANARYLTSIGGNGAPVTAVFPREGDVTAITGPVPEKAYWLAFQDWVQDIRPSFFSLGDALIQRLRELGVEHGRIGLAGLALVPRLADGIIASGTVEKIRAAFPSTEIVNATFLMDEARFVKSEEEIAFLRQAVALAERAVEVLKREARPGTPENVVYARMQAAMVEQGGELPMMLLWSAGNPQPLSNAFMPTRRKLAKSDVIAAEIEGRWAGYTGQVTIPAVIGKPSSDYIEMFRLQQKAVQAAFERMKPGVTIGEVLALSEQIANGTPYLCRMILHGRGLGADAPIAIFGSRDPRVQNWRLEENSVFVVKPVVMTPQWVEAVAWGQEIIGSANPADPSGSAALGAKTVCWGDSVVVRAHGAERLGKRPAELLRI